MRKTLAIDVGIDGLGCAFFRGLELEQAWYSEGPSRVIRDGPKDRSARVWKGVAMSIAWLRDDVETYPDVVVIETMKVYAGRSGFGKDAADLLLLQGIAGVLLGVFEHAEPSAVLACDWKGQVRKAVMTDRIKGWIARHGWRDRVIMPEHKPALVHNAIDAAGLGMVALGIEGRSRIARRARLDRDE